MGGFALRKSTVDQSRSTCKGAPMWPASMTREYEVAERPVDLIARSRSMVGISKRGRLFAGHVSDAAFRHPPPTSPPSGNCPTNAASFPLMSLTAGCTKGRRERGMKCGGVNHDVPFSVPQHLSS